MLLELFYIYKVSFGPLKYGLSYLISQCHLVCGFSTPSLYMIFARLRIPELLTCVFVKPSNTH